MRFTLVGNGRMGQQVAQVIRQSGNHEVSAVLDINTTILSDLFQGSDAIIDFTVREAFLANLPAMLKSGVPVVVGTTGWDDMQEEVKRQITAAGASMLYSANFSLGVNIFLRTVREAAKLIAPFGQFDIAFAEQHHLSLIHI